MSRLKAVSNAARARAKLASFHSSRAAMGLFGRKKTTVGLDIGSGLVKVAVVDHSKSTPELVKVAITPLPDDAIVEGEVMDPHPGLGRDPHDHRVGWCQHQGGGRRRRRPRRDHQANQDRARKGSSRRAS